MRKLVYILLATVLLPLSSASLLSSCTLEHSDNGDLDGFWHLERIDTIYTGGVNDMSDKKVFWAVEYKLLKLQGGGRSCLLRFRQTADSLVLSSPHSDGGHQQEYGSGGDIPLEDASVLKPYGIQHLEEHFLKEAMKSSRMILRTDSFRLYFKKF